MTTIRYTLSSEKREPAALASDAVAAGKGGFEYALISDHYHHGRHRAVRRSSETRPVQSQLRPTRSASALVSSVRPSESIRRFFVTDNPSLGVECSVQPTLPHNPGTPTAPKFVSPTTDNTYKTKSEATQAMSAMPAALSHPPGYRMLMMPM